jgi:RNA polymerase sigma factor (sigma-70 family)
LDSRPVTVDALLEHRGWVRALARTLVFDRSTADDVEQDAWLAALRRPPRDDRSLRSWFARVVRSRAHDRRRSETQRTLRETAVARPEAVASSADVSATTEIHRNLAAALLTLEEPYRSAVILRYFEDLPPREIAARTGVAVETARTRVKRGIERLRERLDARHDGDRRAWTALVAPLAARRWTEATSTGGAILATKKTAALAALLLLAVSAGLAVWLVADRGAPRIPARESPPTPAVDATHPTRAARPQADEKATPAASAAPDPVEGKPDRPIVAVVDAVTRKPIAGATVVVVRADGTTMWGNPGGAEGRWTLDPSLVGVKATLWAAAPGHARRRLVDVALAAEVLSIALEPAKALQLRFVTDAGRALDADEVRALFTGSTSAVAFELVADDAIHGNDVPRMLRLIFGPSADWRTTVEIDRDGASLRLVEGVSKGRWRLFVRRPGATPWLSDAFVADGATPPTVVVPLPETPRTRRVRLVADDRTPLAGAALVPWHEFGDDRAFLPGEEVHADAQGVAALPWDPPESRSGGRPPTWWVRAPGRVGMIAASTLDDPDAAQPIEIAVPAAARVEGEAYLPSGLPAVGCRVATAQKGMTWSTTVRADGSFRMTDVATRDGFVDLMLLAGDTFKQVRATLGPDGVARAVFGSKDAGARGRIAGVVTSGGAPLAGLFVVDQPRGAKGAFTRTGADGRFALEGLDVAVEHDFVVYAGDPQADDSAHRIRTAAPLRVEAGKTAEFAFDLPAGAIRVKVVDSSTGEAIVGARVFGGPVDAALDVARFPGFDYRVGWAGFTDEDGWVVLRGLAPAASHKLHAQADGHEPADRDGVAPGTHDAPVDVELRLARTK